MRNLATGPRTSETGTRSGQVAPLLRARPALKAARENLHAPVLARTRQVQRPTVSTRRQPSPSGDSLSGRSASATTTFVPVPETFSHRLP